MDIRNASFANSWYTGDGLLLDAELSAFLDAVKPAADAQYAPPISGCKAIIAPHAGYLYSGPAAAWAYKGIDVAGIKRVFILGPSHHHYLDGCALSMCKEYHTPIGNLPLDLETIEELRATGKFKDMELQVDEHEHSIEMHLPFVRKIFRDMDIKIVPILVGAISTAKEAHFGRLLSPYLAREDTFCVVSSDFCHWGARFSYTYYKPPGDEPAISLSRTNSLGDTLAEHPIHASISALDREAMTILTLPRVSASKAHEEFRDYLTRTKNTICGRHPIGVLFGILASLEESGKQAVVRWVRYEQSSQCLTTRDSSVSYASAYVAF